MTKSAKTRSLVRACKTYSFDSAYDGFFAGTEFTPALSARLARPELNVPVRMEVLLALATGQRVVHVGCVDHLPILEEKLAQGAWLHGQLCNIAERCYGVDLNTEGIERLREKGYKDLASHDLSSAEALPDIVENQWDLLLLGEVIEHIDNPGEFLSAIRKTYAGSIKQMLVTTPNALCYSNFRHALRQRELVSSDHRCWYSPLTLAKVMTLAGFKVQWVSFCQYEVRPRTPLEHLLLRACPALRDTILMLVNF